MVFRSRKAESIAQCQGMCQRASDVIYDWQIFENQDWQTIA